MALRIERGDRFARPRRWQGRVVFAPAGDVQPEDMGEIRALLKELRPLVAPLELILSDEADGSDVQIEFLPRETFGTRLPGYRGQDHGLFWFDWNARGVITGGRVLISSSLRGATRRHILREELVQVLGLPGDSNRYRDSIFFANWTDTTSLTELDREVIRFHYDPGLDDDTRLAGELCVLRNSAN